MNYSRLVRVFSWWQNGAMVATFAICALVLGCFGIPAGQYQPVIVAMVIVCAAFAVRSAMIGVSRDRTGLIRIRGVVRTWKLRPEQILFVEAAEYQRMDGRRYFAPVVVLDRTVDRRPELQLWWLSAITERGAQKWADRVNALLATGPR